MKRAEELYVLIKSKLFGEQTVQEEEETVASAGAEVDNTSSEEVKQLNDRFAIRDQVILQKQLAETTEEEEEETSLQTLSITEVSVETEIEDTTTASTASTLVFKSVFGSKEQEPPLTNWNGEFKG